MTEKTLSLEKHVRLQEKRVAAVSKEKESLQRELNKSILLQEKLKDVCREQQKLIKSISNERLQQIQKEEQRHKENQEKFQSSLDEINKMLAKNNEENLRLRNENIEMSQQLLSLSKQCDTREKQVKGIESKIEIDAQLQEAKLKKIQIEYKIESETLLQQKEVLAKKLLEADAMMKDFRDRETVLSEQIQMYSNKYEGFQSAIQRSNDMFDKYKKEIETMSRNTRKLEKELLQWKKKYDQCNASLLSITKERKNEMAESIKCAKQLEQLKKLLRTLHVERTALYKILSENNIETPNLRNLIPEREITDKLPETSKSNTLEEVVLKSCADLKDALPEVQEELK